MRTLFIALSLMIFTSINAQVQKNYAQHINAADAEKHLTYLASDELEGREAGEKGQKLAAAYLMQNFVELGLKPINGSYFQRFNLMVNHPEKIKISVGSDTLRYFNDFLHNADFDDVNFSNSAVVFAGYGIEAPGFNELKNIDIKGKVVIIADKEPRDKKGNFILNKSGEKSVWSDRKHKINNLQNKGAKAVIIVNKNIAFYQKSYKHHFTSSKMQLATDSFNYSLPVLFFSEQMADSILLAANHKVGYYKALKKITKKKKPMSAELNIKMGVHAAMIDRSISSENVLGYVEGTTKKDELIVVTAHYDHIGQHDGEIFNGADDDGSGTTALLLMAKAFAKAKADGHGPKRSILFMPVSAEEKGLLGSRYYSENPIFPLEKTVANLNIDMIGRVDEAHTDSAGNLKPNYVYIIGSDFLSTDLHEINEQQNDKYTRLELDYRYNSITDPNRFYQRSDHYNFAKNNVPVIFYFNGTHEDYHKATDTIEKINFDKIAHITQLIYYTAWELANRADRIKLN